MDPRQSDVLDKLARSGASERHAFILVPGFSTAPFGVVDMLRQDKDQVVPTLSLKLPEQVTHVWLMTFWTTGSAHLCSTTGVPQGAPTRDSTRLEDLRRVQSESHSACVTGTAASMSVRIGVAPLAFGGLFSRGVDAHNKPHATGPIYFFVPGRASSRSCPDGYTFEALLGR